MPTHVHACMWMHACQMRLCTLHLSSNTTLHLSATELTHIVVLACSLVYGRERERERSVLTVKGDSRWVRRKHNV
jgi:hypothetical protein